MSRSVGRLFAPRSRGGFVILGGWQDAGGNPHGGAQRHVFVLLAHGTQAPLQVAFANLFGKPLQFLRPATAVRGIVQQW